MFQSLAGFLGRCDDFQQKNFVRILMVFQSLAGFLGRCDNRFFRSNSFSLVSFNPWRVFLVVATLCR